MNGGFFDLLAITGITLSQGVVRSGTGKVVAGKKEDQVRQLLLAVGIGEMYKSVLDYDHRQMFQVQQERALMYQASALAEFKRMEKKNKDDGVVAAFLGEI